MKRITLLIILLLIIISLVGVSNYRIKQAALPLIEPVNIPRSASMQVKLVSIDKWLLKLSKDKKFNGAILVSKDNEPDLIKTYGYQDLQKEIPLTLQSSFRLGSVSKQFTAMAIMILHKQGRLEYDDPIQKYLPTFPYNDVSIRNLLIHSSGIADYMDLALKDYFSMFTKIGFYFNQSMVNIFYNGEPSEYKDHYTILTSKDVLRMVGKYSSERLFLSGDRYLYSNTGYVILSLIVETVSEKSFETFLDEEIFYPLEMKNSSFWNLFTKKGKLSNRVQGTNGNRLNDYSWLDGVSGDGSVFLSIEDFLKWDKAIINNSLTSQSEFDEALNPFVSSMGDTTYYGFGWSLNENGNSISHGGSWLGAVTYIYRNLLTNSMFVLLESSTSKYSYEIRKEIQRVLNKTEPHMFIWKEISSKNY